jgi:hypothetical protein
MPPWSLLLWLPGLITVHWSQNSMQLFLKILILFEAKFKHSFPNLWASALIGSSLMILPDRTVNVPCFIPSRSRGLLIGC